MSEVRFDLAQYYSMKAVIEQVLGRNAFRKLKDAGSLKDWIEECSRLLKALSISISASVLVADKEWREEIERILVDGIRSVEESPSVDELFARMSATLVRSSFLQVGQVPRSHLMARAKLMPAEWRLTSFRTVQYVQTAEQKEALRRTLEKRRDTHSRS